MEEIWKNIPSYEGLYQVSNLGRVKSLSRKSWNGVNYFIKKDKILKNSFDKYGYLRVGLRKNNKTQYIKVHTLVGLAFLKNDNNFKEINHIDGNKANNCVENLEYCSRSHNIKEMYRIGLKKTKTINQYSINNEFIKKWESILSIEKELNIDSVQIINCCKKRQKTSHGYVWKYADE